MRVRSPSGTSRAAPKISTLMDGWWVKYVSFSPNGSRVVYGSSAPDMQLWDAETGRTATLEGYTSPGTSAAFSPDGTVLASGEEDGTIRLWNPETGVNTAVLEGHEHIVNSVAFSSDGAILASASGDGSVGLWDVATEARTGTLLGHHAHVLSVAFAPGSDLLASGGWNGSLMLWNATTQRNVAVLSGHTGKVPSVAFSPDASVLASASEDGSVGLWDLTTGHARLVSGHTDFIHRNRLVSGREPTGHEFTNRWTGRVQPMGRNHRARTRQLLRPRSAALRGVRLLSERANPRHRDGRRGHRDLGLGGVRARSRLCARATQVRCPSLRTARRWQLRRTTRSTCGTWPRARRSTV